MLSSSLARFLVWHGPVFRGVPSAAAVASNHLGAFEEQEPILRYIQVLNWVAVNRIGRKVSGIKCVKIDNRTVPCAPPTWDHLVESPPSSPCWVRRSQKSEHFHPPAEPLIMPMHIPFPFNWIPTLPVARCQEVSALDGLSLCLSQRPPSSGRQFAV